MTYGRRHYLTQQILVRLAWAGPSNTETREFLRATTRFVIGMILVFFGLVATASGAEGEASTGEFRYRPEPDAACESAPLVFTRVRFDVTGVIARATVTQRFRNPRNAWIEGVYVFPLPESAAVDHMRMRAGDRVIEGQIREKEKARQEFQQAAAEGKRTTLVEQQRSNLFTSRVANLGPFEELEVEIEYQQTLEVAEGRVGIRFPLAITPRYTPAIDAGVMRLVSASSSPAGDLVQPPFLSPAVKGNPVSIELNLNAGFEVASVTSDTHPLEVETKSAREFRARLRDEVVPADRDFEVSWKALPGVMPQSSIATEKGPDGTYALVTLFPPAGGAVWSVRIPREVTFVIDTSGSMAGASMEQAKNALALAIKRLDASDSFNVIEFNSVTSALFPHPVPASPEHRDRAVRFALGLEANGGTEMLPALVAALSSHGTEAEETSVKQVIFLTDGAVSNEDQLFAVIKSKLGRARLFTVGIGSAPNSHFMTKAAEFGRGTFTYISDVNAVEKQMTELYAKIESPVLSDIHIAFDGVGADKAEVWPARVPDLYLGEPVVVGARFDETPAAIRVTGRRDGQPFETLVPMEQASSGRGINVLWARRKIQSLLDGLHSGDDPEVVRTQVVSLGLTHHLVTKHTSLVAVDVTPVRPLEEPMESATVPVNAPHGSAGGTLPRAATAATLFLLEGLAASIAAVALFVLARRS